LWIRVSICPWDPENIIFSVVVGASGEHEKQVRKPIQVDLNLRIDPFGLRQSKHFDFGSTTNGSSDVKICGGH
jgi:hypothetical protein